MTDVKIDANNFKKEMSDPQTSIVKKKKILSLNTMGQRGIMLRQRKQCTN